VPHSISATTSACSDQDQLPAATTRRSQLHCSHHSDPSVVTVRRLMPPDRPPTTTHARNRAQVIAGSLASLPAVIQQPQVGNSFPQVAPVVTPHVVTPGGPAVVAFNKRVHGDCQCRLPMSISGSRSPSCRATWGTLRTDDALLTCHLHSVLCASLANPFFRRGPVATHLQCTPILGLELSITRPSRRIRFLGPVLSMGVNRSSQQGP
jgi:hypothetical protein